MAHRQWRSHCRDAVLRHRPAAAEAGAIVHPPEARLAEHHRQGEGPRRAAIVLGPHYVCSPPPSPPSGWRPAQDQLAVDGHRHATVVRAVVEADHRQPRRVVAANGQPSERGIPASCPTGTPSPRAEVSRKGHGRDMRVGSQTHLLLCVVCAPWGLVQRHLVRGHPTQRGGPASADARWVPSTARAPTPT